MGFRVGASVAEIHSPRLTPFSRVLFLGSSASHDRRRSLAALWTRRSACRGPLAPRCVPPLAATLTRIATGRFRARFSGGRCRWPPIPPCPLLVASHGSFPGSGFVEEPSPISPAGVPSDDEGEYTIGCFFLQRFFQVGKKLSTVCCKCLLRRSFPGAQRGGKPEAN